MNFQKENHEIVRQNDKIVKKSQKHDANLQKNSTLYFQIGLILTLSLVYGLFEMKFEKSNSKVTTGCPVLEEEIYVYNDQPIIYEELIAKNEVKKREPVILSEPIIAENDEPIIETENIFPEPETSSTPQMTPDEVPPVIEIEDEVPIIAVEQIPVYPGCEDLRTRKDKRACMEQKLAKLIDRKFDKEIASDYGLTGVQKIYVQFKIDKSGNVTDIKARAPHKALEKEAKKVIGKVPQMKPGMQAKKPVNVIYSIPILFKVQD